MRKVFCGNCKKDVTHVTIWKLMYTVVDGEKYNYHGKICLCNSCGKEVFSQHANDYNIAQRNKIELGDNND